jgi:hypothetical protein
VEIVVDDLTGPQIATFLDEHLREMLSITPPESGWTRGTPRSSGSSTASRSPTTGPTR